VQRAERDARRGDGVGGDALDVDLDLAVGVELAQSPGLGRVDLNVGRQVQAPRRAPRSARGGLEQRGAAVGGGGATFLFDDGGDVDRGVQVDAVYWEQLAFGLYTPAEALLAQVDPAGLPGLPPVADRVVAGGAGLDAVQAD